MLCIKQVCTAYLKLSELEFYIKVGCIIMLVYKASKGLSQRLRSKAIKSKVIGYWTKSF